MSIREYSLRGHHSGAAWHRPLNLCHMMQKTQEISSGNLIFRKGNMPPTWLSLSLWLSQHNPNINPNMNPNIMKLCFPNLQSKARLHFCGESLQITISALLLFPLLIYTLQSIFSVPHLYWCIIILQGSTKAIFTTRQCNFSLWTHTAWCTRH